MFSVLGDMSEGQFSVSEQCHLAELLHDLTIAEEYAYGRSDWDASTSEKNVSIGSQLLRYCNCEYHHLLFKVAMIITSHILLFRSWLCI